VKQDIEAGDRREHNLRLKLGWRWRYREVVSLSVAVTM